MGFVVIVLKAREVLDCMLVCETEGILDAIRPRPFAYGTNFFEWIAHDVGPEAQIAEKTLNFLVGGAFTEGCRALAVSKEKLIRCGLSHHRPLKRPVPGTPPWQILDVSDLLVPWKRPFGA